MGSLTRVSVLKGGRYSSLATSPLGTIEMFQRLSVILLLFLTLAVPVAAQTDTCTVSVVVDVPDTTRSPAGDQAIIEIRVENPTDVALDTELRCSVGGFPFSPVPLDRLGPGTSRLIPLVTFCFGATDTLVVTCDAESQPVGTDCVPLVVSDSGVLACGAAVPIQRRTWGLLKARFDSRPM